VGAPPKSVLCVGVLNMITQPFGVSVYAYQLCAVSVAARRESRQPRCGDVLSSLQCRYYAICRPLKARYVHTVRRAVCLVVVFWAASLVVLF